MKTDQVFHPRIELVYGVIIVDKYSFNIPNTTNKIFSTLLEQSFSSKLL